MFYIASILSVF